MVAPLVLDKLSVGCSKNGGTSDMGDSGISSDPASMTSPGIAAKCTLNILQEFRIIIYNIIQEYFNFGSRLQLNVQWYFCAVLQ